MSSDKTARERFIEAVLAAGGSKLVAKRLGCSRSYIDMIRIAQRRPGMRIAFGIEREFGIPMKNWLDAEAAPGKPAGPEAA